MNMIRCSLLRLLSRLLAGIANPTARAEEMSVALPGTERRRRASAASALVEAGQQKLLFDIGDGSTIRDSAGC
jgi:hypothetical protein